LVEGFGETPFCKKGSPRKNYYLLAVLGLKGCAKGVAGVIGTARSNRNFLGGTAGFHVVIVAVLNAALNALDMLATAIGFVSSVFFHDQSSFPTHGSSANDPFF
jgi:hypothetical protein